VYFERTEVAKVVVERWEISSALREQDLAGEASILTQLEGLSGVPIVSGYLREGGVECLRLLYIRGQLLSERKLTLRILAGILASLIRISARGVAHRDITEGNIIIDEAGRPHVVDFDQARITGPLASLKANLIGGWPSDSGRGLGSLVTLRLKRRTPGWARRSLRRLIPRRTRPLARLPADASPQLIDLQAAWKIARQSSASSPGIHQAYYEEVFQGHALPGERPWSSRWAAISELVDFGGQRILDLGCNVGLASVHALLEGAKSAMAVDADADILRAAKLVASAHGVSPTFRQLDFDVAVDLRAEFPCADYDIVLALNVFNWVSERDRFLSFLEAFRVLLYEGHEAIGVESNRLRSRGFSIRRSTVTERSRPLILAVRD
jgi:SAM-dependent methyltransferase